MLPTSRVTTPPTHPVIHSTLNVSEGLKNQLEMNTGDAVNGVGNNFLGSKRITGNSPVLDVLYQSFSNFPSNSIFLTVKHSISLSVKVDDHNFLIWHDQLLCFIMA